MDGRHRVTVDGLSADAATSNFNLGTVRQRHAQATSETVPGMKTNGETSAT